MSHLVLHDSAVGLDKGLSIKGGFPEQHLVEADTERPPVTLASIHTSTILHCLCGVVQWCTVKTPCSRDMTRVQSRRRVPGT